MPVILILTVVLPVLATLFFTAVFPVLGALFLTSGLGNGPAPRIEPDVVYREVEGDELHLDAFLPSTQGPHPALLLVHGGSWMWGDKRDMRPIADVLVQRGYACFAPEYRLAPAHHYPAQIEDCVGAVQFLRANAERFDIDPARIGAFGLSAGGHLVSMLGVLDERADPTSDDPVKRQSSRVQCVVSFFGPAKLTREKELEFDTMPPPEFLGDAPSSAYEDASPVHFVTRDDAPFLLVHGDADPKVPLGHSVLMDEELRAAGVPSELLVVHGGGHGDFLRKDPMGEHLWRTDRFLARNLGSVRNDVRTAGTR